MEQVELLLKFLTEEEIHLIIGRIESIIELEKNKEEYEKILFVLFKELHKRRNERLNKKETLKK